MMIMDGSPDPERPRQSTPMWCRRLLCRSGRVGLNLAGEAAPSPSTWAPTQSRRQLPRQARENSAAL